MGALGALGDLGPPPSLPDPVTAGPEASFDGLGDIPESSAPDPARGFDLGAILEPAPGSGPPTPTGGSGFTFGGSLADFSGDRSQPSLSGGDEPTQNDGTGRESPKASSGWRVRNERGVVYELMTVDAVVAWLQGRADITGVRIAQGSGGFEGIDRFPRIASRVGTRGSPSLAPPTNSGTLSLAMERAPSPHRNRAPTSSAASAEQKQGPVRSENPVGMGAVLVLLVGAMTLSGAAVFAAVKTGSMSLPAVAPGSSDLSKEAPPSPALARAIAAYEAEKYTAATRLLKNLTKKRDDPRAFRYLALALHRSNRAEAAREALMEYRLRMQRAGGDGRQVRKVRH